MWKPENDSHPWLSILNLTTNIHLGDLSTTLPSSSNLTIQLNDSTEGDEKYINCVPPSINEFPDDFFDLEQRLQGGILVHALIVAYVCSMLAIVCDRYFVPSLSVISNYFNVPSDIAGATFMAVGTSSPELFSSVIGAFIAKGDIGIGTVVGSAVFNILAVTGASGLALWTVASHLEWYPITRDCSVYILTVAALVVVIHDNIVTWVEALALLVMFIGYLVLLYFNRNIHNASTKTVENIKSWWYKDQCYNLEDLKKGIMDETAPLLVSNRQYPARYHSYADSACPSSEASSITLESDLSLSIKSSTSLETSSKSPKRKSKCRVYLNNNSTSGNSSDTSIFEDYNLNELESSDEFSLLKPPQSWGNKIFWILMWPANLLFFLTIPNCNSKGKVMWFPLTFFSSIIWLGVLSYLTFWMVAIIGFTFGIPDTVSGITILAAGTSVPELVASVIVVKKGLSNMAISNLIGSNIFDILFCLGLPWLVKTLMNVETRTMVINSSALTYTTIMLLMAVVLFYLALVLCHWKLGWRMGVISLCLYSTFLVLASLYESNVFGEFNPPPCPLS